MKVYIILAVLFTMLIGTSLAQNATTGDVNAFKQALEKDGFTVQKGGLGFFDGMCLAPPR
jgi:TRAP-type C4-dicarboxylate transport system permease large subunit